MITILCDQTTCKYELNGSCFALGGIKLFAMQKNYPKEMECQTFKKGHHYENIRFYIKPTPKVRNK